MIGRVSSFGLGETMLRSSLAVQSKYATASTQQASGLTSTTYGGLGSKSSSLMSTETATAQLTTWSANTSVANDRVQSMVSAVGDMIDALTSFRSTLSAAKSSTSNDTLDDTGSDLLEDLTDLMNLKMDGRYLFAGSNTDTAPVDVSALTAPASPSTADTSYYTGDSEQSSVRVSSQQTISYGVSGNNTGFEKALRTANIVANITTSPLDTDSVNEAYDLATEALDALIAIQSTLGNTQARLETAVNRQEAALEQMDTIASNLKEVDTAKVAVQISQYKTQLEASYSALGNVGQLSLVKYL